MIMLYLVSGALFISTEDAFPTKRLHQLAANATKKFGIENINLMDQIYIEHAADVVCISYVSKILVYSSVLPKKCFDV